MITLVKDFISTIITDVRATSFVTGKVSGGSWISGAPFYFYGTPIEVNHDLLDVRAGQNKFPAVFLFDPIDTLENDDMMVNVGASPNLKIFFMNDWRNQEGWTTEDHYDNIIADMDSLKREFIKKLKANKYVLEVTTYSTARHAKWGLFINNKGYKDPVFNEKLSGVSLDITIDIDKLIDGCNLFDE